MNIGNDCKRQVIKGLETSLDTSKTKSRFKIWLLVKVYTLIYALLQVSRDLAYDLMRMM